MGALGGGGRRSFHSMTREQREQVLRGWGDSRLPQRRAVFQALRKAALLFYYILPGRFGGRNPAWAAIAYDGPLGPLPGAPPKALNVTAIERDTRLQCDVVIVGSGAGGGAAAGVLTSAGLDVIVVEGGDYYDDRDFDGSEFKAQTWYYMGAPNATHDQSVGLIAGACLGGGTVVNYSTSFRTPDEIRQQWAQHGVPAFTSEDYTRSLDAVCERLGVNQEHNEPSLGIASCRRAASSSAGTSTRCRTGCATAPRARSAATAASAAGSAPSSRWSRPGWPTPAPPAPG